jgi:hypothetical protein
VPANLGKDVADLLSCCFVSCAFGSAFLDGQVPARAFRVRTNLHGTVSRYTHGIPAREMNYEH